MEHSSRRRRERSPLRKAGKILEIIGGVLLCLLIIATPWMFGTTETWSVQLMNIGSYCAGAVFLAAVICNKVAGSTHEESGRERLFKYLFLGLNLAVLGYCALALWNWRATFSAEDRSFNYRDSYNSSLPTTYDANLTRATLLSFIAYFILFWSLRYWVLQGERRSREGHDQRSIWSNKRLQIITWIMALNGFAIALQGILQRLSGSGKLLWFRDSWWGTRLACFGPFSYRGNAAEYLNLLWPLAIGLWWVMSRERRRRMGTSRVFTDGPELLLIPATIVTIAGSIITLSRGGAVIAIATLLGIAVVLLLQKNVSRWARIGVALLVCVVVASSWLLSSRELRNRFKTADLTRMGGRSDIYKNAGQMLKDFPVFGSGPGAFSSVYHLYRTEEGDVWHSFLHDDWTETRITFGQVGFGLILANLGVLVIWIIMPGRPEIPSVFMWCAAGGLVATLVHAGFDFPFQTYSVFYTFVAIASLLSSLSPERR